MTKVGFTCGAFDLCHAGHFLMFKDCKEVCDYLIVGLHTNPNLDRKNKNIPIQSIEERRIILEGIKYIDEIILYDTEKDLYNLLLDIKQRCNSKRISKKFIRIIGSDWKDKEFTGYDLPIEVHYHNRSHNYSSSELRKRVWEKENENISNGT